MEPDNNKQAENVDTKVTTDETNHSANNEVNSNADSPKSNEVEEENRDEIINKAELELEEDKIKLVFDDGDDDDEDIPGDFFDDFLKEDFMAGLDIVDDDDWNDEDGKPTSASKPNHKSTPKETKKEEKEKPKKLKKTKKKEESVASKQSSIKDIQSNDVKEESIIKKQSNVRDKRSNDDIEPNEFDIRRDPKKTRRDIVRDKERCDKDKEKKIISEKLQLVETGLVPPGTEMEIDMEEIKKQKKDLDHKVKNPVKSLSKSPKRKQTSLSPKDGKSSKKVSPRRKRNPVRKLVDLRKTSPLKKTSPRHRVSPLRKTSPLRKISPLLPREDRSLRRSRSPYYRRTRYSPAAVDRRRSPLRRRSTDRRRSPAREGYSRRRRSRSRSPKRRQAEKKSFLQEIAEKLNETRPMMVQPMMMGPMPHMMQPYHHQEMQYIPEPMQMQPSQMMPNPMMHVPVPPIPVVPAPVPTPVPAPNVNLYKPEQAYDPFDQSFFIGTPAQPLPVQKKPAENLKIPKAVPTMNSAPAPNKASLGTMLASKKGASDLPEQTRTIIDKLNKSSDDIPKLFQDKKISLSEFLAITAKPEVVASSPANLKEKIRVISRCQDAISYLGTSDKKFSGRLMVRKTPKNPSDPKVDKYRSPLLTAQPKIIFTEVPTRSENEASFSSYINRLLQHIGILDEVAVDLDDYSEKNSGKSKPAIDKTPPAPPPPPQISKPKRSAFERSGFESVKKRESPKAVRADPSRCSECERRAKKLFKSSGVQCSQDSIKYSVSTQFPEEDPSTKFPKSQSLASLTPAQLLAHSVPTTSRFKDEFDLYGRGRGMPPMQPNDLNLLNYRRYQPFF